MEKLALTIPGGLSGTPPVEIRAPEGVPTGLSLPGLVNFFLQGLLVAGLLLSLAYLIYGGWFWIQSKGDKETLNKARRILIYAIFGIVVMSLALVAVNLVSQAFTGDTVIGAGGP